MKSFPKRSAIAFTLLAGGVFALRADLTQWAENIDGASRLEAVFFRTVLLPSGAVPVRRAPRETRPELTKLLAAAPNDSELYTLRALEAEQQLDFTAAEADWKKNIDVAADKGAARAALSDFYHRRLRPLDEFAALSFAAREFAPDSEKLLPPSQQRPWKLYERLAQLGEEQQLESQLVYTQYWAWIQRFPGQPSLYRNFFNWTLTRQRWDAAGEIITAYEKVFPQDAEFPIQARAELAAKLGPAPRALEVYESSFRPLWPDALVKQYFDLLKQTNGLRAYLEKARAGVAANPLDLASTARLYYYWQQQGNPAAAERALAEFRQRKVTRQSAWTSEELLTLARLFEASHNYDEAARNYYALYSVTQSNEAIAENALASLIRLIFSAPEQPIRFGSGNLTLYRDVATLDPHPGFLNGILSLLLNETDPPNRAAQEEQSAGAYFRRQRAAELVALFESRFPNSTSRAELRERVIEAFAVYGSNEGVIRAGTRFMTEFPNAGNRTSVALRLADAYARTNQAPQEFALYDGLLAELAKRADGVPLGSMPAPAPVPPPAGGGEVPANNTVDRFASVRSPEYGRVLDRYVARLVSLKRTRDALALYRREIDRNPTDPGLYDVLAAYLEQNRFGVEVEQTYQKAIAQFQDHSWQSKLARWYLRQRRSADVARLTRDVVKIFSGTELDGYFREIVKQGAPVGPAMYLQLNLFAHQRFPHHLSFVRNLLTAYSTKATLDDSAFEALLRRHWYDAPDLRLGFFERLSRTGRLDAELSLVRTSNPNASAGRWTEAVTQSPAAVRVLAEGEAWRGHFENAAPMFLAIENDFPADRSLGTRTAAVYRSLGTIDPKVTDTAIAVNEKLSQYDPRDRATLTRLGEIEADRERFDKARGYWDRIARIEPARADGYLESATVFWDYYRYPDALRVIEDGRKALAGPALFAYEAGAIRENQRDYPGAIVEYAKGALEQGGSKAEQRLLALARRPAYRARVDQLTENLASARNPDRRSLNLRVALLRDQNRRDDLERFLLAVTGRATDSELLTIIENNARVDGFPKAQQTAIEREVTVATDSVEKMRLRLSLTRFLEEQGNQQQAAQVVDALYRENPTVLGVVRATVDYHWREKNPRRAIDVLEEAAQKAEAEYRNPFTLEAARKSIESADYNRARGFMTKLLAAEPYRGEYIAVMADSYAKQGDNAGLRTFYAAKIQALGSATLPPAQKIEQIAEMRRALIPVLTRVKDFNGGVDQYIEILNRYPEDEGLAREAALYASSNGVARRLHDFYAKAVTDSPQDFRWPMVLARIETQAEDFASAITSYTRAMTVRPDRADLLEARLNLEQRLLRFDEAAASAQKLYDLTYRNSIWLEKLAEIRARQGQTDAAVAALNRAWIEGRPDRAANYMNVARRLESWGMLAEARRFAEEGLKRSATEDLPFYARILTRQRDYTAAFARLAGVNAEIATAASHEIAETVGRYYSPDEKVKFAVVLATQPRRIEMAQIAGLFDLQARWINQGMMASPGSAASQRNKDSLIELQIRRLRFEELGTQLEALDRAIPAGVQHTNELEEAANQFRASGNTTAELRVLQRQHDRGNFNGPLFERYCQLLLVQPARMIAAITSEAHADQANAMLNYVVQHATPAIAQQAIAARSAAHDPLWTRAYTSLAGLYYSNATAPVKDAFTAMLGDMTIGARIGKPVDRAQQLAGDLWFYYGGRYGEYLGVTKQAGADDFLPAMVEATPGRSNAYFIVAESARESGNNAAAVVDYRNALELNPRRADVHDRLAMIAAKEGRSDEALREWRLALGAFSEMMDRAHVPQAFWTDLSDTLHHVGEAKSLPPLRADIDKLLRTYIRRSGAFQVDTLLEGAMAATGDPATGIAWVAELSRSAVDPVQFLSAIIEQPWVPAPQKDVLYRRIVESAQAQVAQTFGDQVVSARNTLWTWQLSWTQYLLDRRENERARQLLAGLPQEARRDRLLEIVPLEVRVAARTNGLPAVLARYEEPVPIDALRNAATDLLKDPDEASSRRVLEFIYNHELKAGNLDASNFIGLAEIRLTERDFPGALVLLRRMTLVSGEAYSGLDPAAALLEKTGHAGEAAEFLTALTKAEPWNADARERLAAVQSSTAVLMAVAKSSDATYAVRSAAASELRKIKATPLTDTDSELILLTSAAAFTEAEVNKPYFSASRLLAAAAARDAATRERILAAAIAVDPRPSGPKLDLFRAALETRHNAFALAVARQVQPEDMGDNMTFSPGMADSFLTALPRAERVALARGLGDANQRVGNLAAATAYYQVAQHLEPLDRIARAVDTLQAQLALLAKNEARRPVIADSLEQDRLVHPKVSVP